MRFDACVNFQYSFSIFDGRPVMSDRQKTDLIKMQLSKKFDVQEMGDKNAEDDEIFSQLRTSQEFLHGGGLPFECTRFRIRGLDLKFDKVELNEAAILLSVFSEFNAAQIMFCFTADNATTDQLIYLRQIFAGAAQFHASNGVNASLDGFYDMIASAMGCGHSNMERTYMIEIKKFGNYDSIDDVMENEKKRMYGIICGDEGWQYIPDSLAQERMTNCWGSRNFVRFIVFGSNSMLINLLHSKNGLEYTERQRDFGGRAYGGVNPYFLLDSPVAGIDHGILFAQETVMVIKTISNRVLSRQSTFNMARGKHTNVGLEIRRTRSFRSELITTLNRVGSIGISEVGELEQLLLRSHKITPLVEDIKYLLELLESELDLLYQESTNRLVNLLTVAGLILSVLGLLADMGLFNFIF